jgi:hypothetical protein
MTDLSHTSARYQRTVRRLTADIRAGRIPRMSRVELLAARDALWAAVITTKIAPVRPVVSEGVPF